MSCELSRTPFRWTTTTAPGYAAESMVQFSLVIVGIVFLFGPSANQLAASSSEPSERLFTLRVLPLLEAKCFGCHGGQQDDIKGQLDLTSRASVLRGGESGDPAIVPGRPDESLLIEALLWEGLEMPPKASERLTEKQTEWFSVMDCRWRGVAQPVPTRRNTKNPEQRRRSGRSHQRRLDADLDRSAVQAGRPLGLSTVESTSHARGRRRLGQPD